MALRFNLHQLRRCPAEGLYFWYSSDPRYSGKEISSVVRKHLDRFLLFERQLCSELRRCMPCFRRHYLISSLYYNIW